MRKNKTTILLILIFLIGLSLLVYPTFSNWWNDRHQSRAIATYDSAVSEQDDTQIEDMLAAAETYNENLREERENNTLMMGRLTDDQIEEYNSLLDITGTGIMGYVRIPKIDVELPIYHGTDEAVLQIAVGHIEGSSLPVGGTGTHAVISGHRGLPSAKLFTEIDELGEGDVFIITCLNRKITYQVDQILTVLPEEVDSLEIDPDQDYCTLVTCTPYGINSHRLLVRGHRIANLIEEDIETIDIAIPEREYTLQERLQQILPYLLILTSGFFALALIIPSRKRREEDDEEREWQERRRRRDDRNRGRSRDDRYEDVRRPRRTRDDDRRPARRSRDDDWYDAYEEQDRRRNTRYDDSWEDDYRDRRRYDRDDDYVNPRDYAPAYYDDEPVSGDTGYLDDDDGFLDDDD